MDNKQNELLLKQQQIFIEAIVRENFSEREIKFLSLLKIKVGDEEFSNFINQSNIVENIGLPVHDEAQMTPLFFTLLNNYKKNAKYLIENGANVEIVDEYGNNGFYYVLKNKGSNDDKIELINLLEKNRCKIDSINIHGITLLMHAIFTNTNEEIIRYIINEKKADVNITEYQHGFTALMIAFQNNNIKIFVLLLLKSDIKIINKYGQNILMSTINSEKFDVNHILEYVKEILIVMVDTSIINTVDNSGWSALMIAVNNGYDVIVDLLIEKGANIDIQSDDGYTPLMYAIEKKEKDKDKKFIQKLLKNL